MPVAGQRAEIAEDLEWRSGVQDLMGKLISKSNRVARSTAQLCGQAGTGVTHLCYQDRESVEVSTFDD